MGYRSILNESSNLHVRNRIPDFIIDFVRLTARFYTSDFPTL